MKKRLLYFSAGRTRAPGIFLRRLGVLGLTALVFFAGSCSARTGNQGGDPFPPATVKAFRDAGIPLLRQKVSPRDFTLALAGLPEKSQSPGGLKGKVVLLNFWATWCGPCRAEMPSMEALYARYKNEGFEILAVNSGEEEPAVSAFMGDNGFTFPAALDTDGKVNMSYGVQAIPTSFLLDRGGKIVLRVVGSINWDTPEIRAALECLL